MRAVEAAFWIALAAVPASAQDAPRPPTPLRLVAAPGKPVGFKLSGESSSSAFVGGTQDRPRVSTYEMSVSVEVATGGSSALAVKLRVARVSGRCERMGFGSFDFDSEAPPPDDPMRRDTYFDLTAVAGAEFALDVAADGSVAKVGGVEAARKLALARAGDDLAAESRVKSAVSEESVRGLFLSLVGPAPFPAAAMTTASTWTDKDKFEFDSWEARYDVSRSVKATAVGKDVVRVAGKGTVKLGPTMNVALLPLSMSDSLRSEVASDWTISAADGLPVTGVETITMEGGLAAGAQSMSAKHKAVFRVTRLAAPPPDAVRPMTGSKDIDAAHAKDSEKEAARHDAAKKERQRTGERGAWAVSDDGFVVAAGTPDGDVEVWAADGTRPLKVLKGHTDLVRFIAVAADGSSLYAVSADGTIREWDVGTGKQTNLMGEPNQTMVVGGMSVPAGYTSVALSPDGRYSAFIDMGLEVWDSKKGAYIDPSPDASFPRAAFFLRDSRRMVVACLNSVESFDVQAPPKREPDPIDEKKTWVHLPAVWELHTESDSLFGGGDAAKSLGAGFGVDAAVYEGQGIVVTLVAGDSLAKRSKPTLRAWDLRTGTKRWESTADARTRLVQAPRASFVVVEDASSFRFLSPKDGKSTRVVAKPALPRVARLFAPDASAYFDADRDGNLTRVPLVEPAKTDPAPGGDPAKK
jgi:hypothetical protein